MKEQRNIPFDWGWLAVLASLAFAAYPLLQPGLPSVADATIHLFRTAEWVRIWQDGVLYPRWSPNLAFGHGFPLFIFAPPLPYIIAGALHLLGLSLEVSLKFLPLLGFVLMGVGMYLLVRDVLDDWRAGVVSAAAFVYAPLQLREAYLYGGNYPQFLAIAMFPWVLWTFRRTVLYNRLGDLLVAAMAYAALTLSHNFHAFIFTPVVAVYLIGLVAIERRWRNGWRAVAAGVLGLALSAAFWLPALHERQWTLAHEGFYVVRSNFQLRFLSWRELLAWPSALDANAANPYLPFALGWGTIILAALGLFALLLVRTLSQQQRYHLIFFALLCALALFLVLPVSVSVWEHVPLLATAEFPWRVLGIASLSLSFLAGGSMCGLRIIQPPILLAGNKRGKARADCVKALVAACAVILVIVMVMVYTYPPKRFTPFGTPTLAQSVRYELDTQTIGSTTLGEYLPIWVQQRPLTSQMIDDYLASRSIDKVDHSILPEGTTVALAARSADREIYRVSGRVDWTLRLFTFYYPGWHAYIDGEPAEIVIDEPCGLIAVHVPAGEHMVEVRFTDIPVRAAANAVSLVAWFGTLLGVAYTAVARRRRHATDAPVCAERSGRPREVLIATGVILLAFVVRGGVVDPFTLWFRQQSPSGQVLGVQHPTAINFENKVALLGYELSGEPAMPGDRVHVRLYWQALEPLGKDFSTFVHLDALPDLTTRAQSDNVHPGDARAQIDVPVRNWTPQTYVRDEHELALPADLDAIGYVLRVGMYDRDGQRLGILDENGQKVESAAFLQPLHVLPREGPDMAGTDLTGYRLGEQIELVGSKIEPTSLQAGGSLTIRLFWRAITPSLRDYTVFAHVLDERGNLVAQSDGQPLSGAYPVSWWWPGQIVEDVHEITLREAVPGTYRAAVGMYDLETGERLPATDARGNPLPDGQIVLQQTISVESP